MKTQTCSPKERGIIFTGEMVRAILDGRKTQTRRAIKLKETPISDKFKLGYWKLTGVYEGYGAIYPVYSGLDGKSVHEFARCPYGRPGDILYVRETFVHLWDDLVHYRATKEPIPNPKSVYKWKPSIFMPRWASRIDLRVTAVDVQRVQDITEEDAVAEGVSYDMNIPFESKDDTLIGLFGNLWDHINEKRGFGWDVNPWVWVVTFERIKP